MVLGVWGLGLLMSALFCLLTYCLMFIFKRVLMSQTLGSQYQNLIFKISLEGSFVVVIYILSPSIVKKQ